MPWTPVLRSALGMKALGIGGLGAVAMLMTVSRAHPAVQLEPVLTGLSSPVYVTSARDGTNRLFVAEQAGRILVARSGAMTPTVFLDITARVLSGGERGLLGLTFHPDYASNRRFFVYYTRPPDGDAVVAEYQATAGDPDVADPMSETVLLDMAHPFANHNGGMIEFGPDGFLYIGTGDGGSANDPGNRAQNVEELLGKILRIDVDMPSPPLPYSSPSDNPFFGGTPGRDEIYAWGLRNPFRFSFDRGTGELIAGDVGQHAREEVDIVERGENYGWRIFEGTRCTNNDPLLCSGTGFIDPIAEYTHTGGRCSITGGYVYRGTQNSLPQGAYVFGDFCTGEIMQLHPVAAGAPVTVLLDTGLQISSFGEDEAGEIYVVGIGGTVHRIGLAPPESGDGGGRGGCFIATAAFGSPLAREVETLRRFRDRHLATNAAGQLVIATYERLSPSVADAIRRHEMLRSATRLALRPVIWAVRLTETAPAWLVVLMLGAAAGGGVAYAAVRLRRPSRAG